MKFLKIEKQVEKLVSRANFSLSPDVRNLLGKSMRIEKTEKARRVLTWILDNADIARQEGVAICQDTGLPVVFIEVGYDIRICRQMLSAIERGVEQGYKKNYLRPSVVFPLKRGKPFYKGIISHIDFSSKIKGIKITIFPKGFGSENKSCLRMFEPTAGLEEIVKFVVESVKKAGAQACPPFVVGVGIGGTSDYALLLAKKALLDRIDRSNSRGLLDKLEKKLFKEINLLGIGPMGLGGKVTALAVKVKTAPTHIAGLPVGVNISCHALRKASMRINI